jgi:glycosyltransferase involved in cell wall biosynthesis
LRTYLARVVPRSVRRAERIIAVSTSTARDLEERLDVRPERIEVIPEAVSPSVLVDESDEVRARRLRGMGIEGPYVLSVGTLEPRKNYPRLLEAWSLLRAKGLHHDLVIAGRTGWMFEPIFECVDRLRLGGCVRFVQPDDAGLAALYRGADLFMYPSLYEGFGIPPLEAMAWGAPVACSNNSSLPEIVGDAGVLFDARSVDAIAGAISRVLDDRALVERLRIAGPVRSRAFSWDRVAMATHQVYEAVARER